MKPTKANPEYVTSKANRIFLPPCGPIPETPPKPFYAWSRFISIIFDQIYEYAVALIKKGKAFVCDLTPEETDEYRRNGKESPFRNRSVAENLDLFARMKAGEFPDGARTCARRSTWPRQHLAARPAALPHPPRRASPHRQRLVHLPDVRFRALPERLHRRHHAQHLHAGIRGAPPALRLDSGKPRPAASPAPSIRICPAQPRLHRHEQAQAHATRQEGLVTGWDDPRMPTISGIRRRGVTPEALRNFAYNIGITKYNGITDVAVLEHAIREDLNKRALRRLAVLRPLKVVITNYPEGQVEELDAVNNPEAPETGHAQDAVQPRTVHRAGRFQEVPPPKFFRLKPGGEVRLKYAYIIKCDEVVKDAAGNITELRCTADLDSKTGGATSGRKVKGTIHWVSAAHAVPAEVRLYDRLFTVPSRTPTAISRPPQPALAGSHHRQMRAELGRCERRKRYQFERLAYFALDKDSAPGKLVFQPDDHVERQLGSQLYFRCGTRRAQYLAQEH
jgi:glutaminyl-tRNA synthetase